MKEIKNDIIKKYKYKDYVIYIKKTKDSYEIYLQNENYGIISLMFGIPKCDIKDMEEIIKNNLLDYIEIYKQDYED